ncbi:MAG TPA: Rieske (2Fe-2S) protein [Ramlibacter sp.]|nr:Rieske (2Fe-2S) protein [Ramlibacter sp.]
MDRGRSRAPYAQASWRASWSKPWWHIAWTTNAHPMPDPQWIPAGPAEALAPGARKLVFVPGGEAVIVFNIGGQFFALENSCPHAGSSIAGGACAGHVITCPSHGLKFDVRSGQCTASAGLRIPTYEVVTQDEQLCLRPPAAD